ALPSFDPTTDWRQDGDRTTTSPDGNRRTYPARTASVRLLPDRVGAPRRGGQVHVVQSGGGHRQPEPGDHVGLGYGARGPALPADRPSHRADPGVARRGGSRGAG